MADSFMELGVDEVRSALEGLDDFASSCECCHEGPADSCLAAG